MKKYLIFILAALGACQEENEVVYSVDPALAPYVETFYTEAQERGVTIPKNLVAKLDNNIQGMTKADRRQDQNYLYVSEVIFNEHKEQGMETQIEALVVYRMAGLFFGVSDPGPEEIADYQREIAFDLFVDNP